MPKTLNYQTPDYTPDHTLVKHHERHTLTHHGDPAQVSISTDSHFVPVPEEMAQCGRVSTHTGWQRHRIYVTADGPDGRIIDRTVRDHRQAKIEWYRVIKRLADDYEAELERMFGEDWDDVIDNVAYNYDAPDVAPWD